MDADEAILFLNRYRDRSRRAGDDPPVGGESFTFKNPHSCQHCSKTVIDLASDHPIFVCWSCEWRGIGRTTDDGQYVCVKCGYNFRVDGITRRYTTTLDYNLSEAISAATAGCVLYSWVIGRMSRIVPMQPNPRAKDIVHTVAGAACCRFQLSAQQIPSELDDGCDFSLSFVCRDTGRKTHLGNIPASTLASDPAAEYVAGRPYNQEVQSEESIAFARRCFQTCMDTHTWCRSDQISHLLLDRRSNTILPREKVAAADTPTRLISITPHGSDGALRAKLVETTGNDGHTDKSLMEHISTAGFMALSYCWGGDQPVKLTKPTYQSLKAGLELSILPQTLQDAVWVAGITSFQYLWIDCLCIFQDDPTDKAIEISRMASYYGRATLTLCAASAFRCTDGFLSTRPDAPFTTGPIRLQLQCKAAGSPAAAGSLYLLEETDPPVEPTATRGWTMQESLLSRRILIFARRQLYWSCVNSFAGCGGSKTLLADRVVPGAQSLLVNGIYPVGSLIDQPTSNQWNRIVEEYSQRALGWGADKLLAVSALAAHMVAMSAKRSGEEPAYAAGLVVDRREVSTWLPQLLWCPARPGATRRVGEYRAPSWSWASVDGEVRLKSWRKGMPAYAGVDGWRVDVAMAKAPYGGVVGGYVVVAAGVRPVGGGGGMERLGAATACSVVWVSEEDYGSNVDGHFDYGPWGAVKGSDDHWLLLLLSDSAEDRRDVEASLARGSGEVLLVGMFPFNDGVEGILVQSLPAQGDGRSQQLYRRCGSFQLRGGRQVGVGYSMAVHRFFDDAPRRTIKII